MWYVYLFVWVREAVAAGRQRRWGVGAGGGGGDGGGGAAGRGVVCIPVHVGGGQAAGVEPATRLAPRLDCAAAGSGVRLDL